MRTDQTYATHHPEAIVLAVSLELAAASWKVALHDGRREKPAVHTVAQPQAAARLQAVLDLIEAHRQKWSLPAGVRVVVSYEAGQEAFWICRALQAQHVECYVVDPASIPVQRHKRRAKTDRLDAIKLVINLRAWLRGERDRMHVVHVPSAQDEASRHLMRERGQLQKEVLQHLDRMRKLLATLGCWEDVAHRAFAERLARDEVRCHDGTPLPPELRERLLRECERRAFAAQQLAVLEKTRQASVPAPARARSNALARLKGIGEVGASRLALELFWVRRETGKEEVVEVHYDEGVANHIGPESCVSYREVQHEALTGVRIGQLLSHDRVLVPGADAVQKAEGNTSERAIASAWTIRRGRRPWHVRTLLAREPGDLQSDRRCSLRSAARIGKARSRSR
jgi:transposase